MILALLLLLQADSLSGQLTISIGEGEYVSTISSLSINCITPQQLHEYIQWCQETVRRPTGLLKVIFDISDTTTSFPLDIGRVIEDSVDCEREEPTLKGFDEWLRRNK